MRRGLAAFAGLVLGTAPLMAQQDDPMAMQRCIWACLANSPGAASAEYNACVDRQCSDIGGAQADDPPPVSQWQSGVASDGRTRFAGVARSGGHRGGLYYMCDAQGQSYLALIGVEGPPGTYRVRVGRADLPVPFDRRRVELSVDVVPGGQVMRALEGPGMGTILDPSGRVVFAQSLTGGAAALRETYAACGR